MITTLIGVLLAIASFYIPLNIPYLHWILLVAGLAILLLFSLATLKALSALRQEEANLTPRVLELFRRDRGVKLAWVGACAFTASSLLLAGGVPLDTALFAGWLVFFGVALDLYRQLLARIARYLDPFIALRLYTAAANASAGNEAQVCDWINATAETSIKALESNHLSLCGEGIEQLKEITPVVMMQEKSQPLLMYLLERYETLFTLALDKKLETVVVDIIQALGNIALIVGRSRIDMVAFPLHFIGRFIAQAQGMGEVDVKGCCTFLEIGHRLIHQTKEGDPLREVFFTLIGQLEATTKAMFKKDKSISFILLTQPFHDLKTMLEVEKLVDHPDVPAIKSDIERILDEFSQLEAAMRQIPSLSEIRASGMQASEIRSGEEA